MANTLLAKGDNNTLLLNGDGSGFTLNNKVINLPSEAGTLALATNTISGAGAGLQVEDYKVSVKIKGGEKVLSATEDGLASTLSLDWIKNDKKIVLRGVNDTVFSEIDATDFVKDGILDTVELSSNDNKEYIVFTWNTDAGKTVLPLDVTKFVDTYTARDGLKLVDHAFSVDYEQVAAVSSLDKYETSAHAASTYETIANVKTLSGKVDTNTTNIGTVSSDLASFKTSAASTYETTAHATSTYAAKTDLDEYLTTTAASATYATIDSLSAYLKSADASSTYAAKSDVNTLSGKVDTNTANISTVSGNLDTLSADVTDNYLTTSGAASTYATTANVSTFKTEVASTYAKKTELEAVTKALLAETFAWSDVTLEKVYDLVKQMAKAMGATIN